MKHKPWKLLALLVFGTLAVVFFGIDLLDGEIATRRIGRVGADSSPLGFAIVVAGYLLGCCMIAFGWFVIRGEWQVNHGPRFKPEFEDPERQRRL